MTPRWLQLVFLVLFAGVSTACTSSAEADGSSNSAVYDSNGASVESDNDQDSEPEPEPCNAQPQDHEFDGLPESTESALIEASVAVFECADAVVLVASGAIGLVGEAARVAIAVSAPLLTYDDGRLSDALRAEIARLGPERIRVYGELDPTEIGTLPVVTNFADTNATSPRPRLDRELADVLATTNPAAAARVIIIEAGQELEAITSLPMLVASGSTILPFDPTDSAAYEQLDAFNEAGANILIDQSLDPTTRWRIDLALAGTELPGGGVELFPDRRLIAFYGSPVTHRLGVLGEQNLERTLERMRPIVDSYRTTDHPEVIPTFEVIATVAAAAAGRDGDYSQEVSVEAVEEWVDFAAENGAYVLIDLQPGRADFLTQAKRYEELLRQPHVGLALDPEWRLGPDERPLTRIGSVEADEVNAVVEWLAEIVRTEALPQKALVLHQFLSRMLLDRETILTPPELAVVVHVDGQGSLGSKFATYENITGQVQDRDQTIWWGWKNFYDEDFPVASPETVNDVDPLPMVVTYQ